MSNNNLVKDAQLVEVVYANDNKKATMTFLNEELGEVLEVNFNKQAYDQGKSAYVDDPDRAQKVEDWSQQYFNTDFDHLTDKIGEKHDIYKYERFNSLYPVDVVEKFTLDDVDDFFTVPIKEIEDDGIAVRIRFERDGKTYESKMTYGKYVESIKKWFPNPQRKTSVYKKFEDKFGVPVEQANKLVGKNIIVEIDKAFNKYAYANIKKLTK